MADLDPALCIQVPGRLVVGPSFGSTALRNTYPYGGLALGIVTGAFMIREEVVAGAHSEARGLDDVTSYRGRVKASFAFTLEQQDTDVDPYTWAISGASGGGYQGGNQRMLPQVGLALAPGLIPASDKLLFAADDPSHPSVLILAPVWTPEARQRLAWRLNLPLSQALVVRCGLDENNQVVRIDKIENLSLS